MNKFLIKYSEIGTKGKNRHVFEDALVKNIKNAIKYLEGEKSVRKVSGRIYVYTYDGQEEETISALKKVFGIAGICPITQSARCGLEGIKELAVQYMGNKYYGEGLNPSFKVLTRRADKTFPQTSMEVSALVGEAVLEAFPQAKVDVNSPEVVLNIEIREDDINIFSEIIPGLSGMPSGTAGKAMLLLSGGIDSPVAGYMIAKRGVSIDAVYFHAPPYTSERAKQKVIDLAKIISAYAGPIKLHIVNFTDIQMKIYEVCPHDELTIIMRRYMMRIAGYFADKEGALGLVTGESIGQVASQTMQSMLVTNEVCTLPVYRPLCAFDKLDIVEISEKIGAYETSILPYEDCCTIFVAKHPVTKPSPERIRKSEALLKGQTEELYQTALDTVEIINI